jgi:quinol monooxygenase YgiN
MTAYNVVRFRVKPGREADFIDLNRKMAETKIPGFRKFAMIRTGERDYCLIGEWTDFNAIVAARPAMIAELDKMRDMLEDLGGGLGVTDPVSGETVLEMSA